MTEPELPSAPAGDHHDQSVRISGKLIVCLMFGFGILSTLVIWVYWNKHIEPFMPLQLEIEENFENSSPRVEGGQRKISKGTPRILRITMRTDRNPSSAENRKPIEQDIRKLRTIAGRHLDLTTYEVFEVHLYQQLPEKPLRQMTFVRSLPDLKELDNAVPR